MTEAALSAATRRRALMTWVVSILRFHVEAGDRESVHSPLKVLYPAGPPRMKPGRRPERPGPAILPR